MSWLILLLVAAMAAAMWWSIRRGTELFVVQVRDGKAKLRRGRIPRGLLDEIDDVVGRPPVREATLIAEVQDQAPKLRAQGDIDAGRLQRLRNVLGPYPLARIRNGNVRR